MYIPEWFWQRCIVFTFAEAWKGSIVFKILILAMYLSVLKRNIWNCILMGLVPCAREKCYKEEPGKPLGPYFPFFPDNLKGRVSDTDFTLHLHFWSAPAVSLSDLLVTQPQFWTFIREKEHPGVMKNLSITFQKLLVFISDISCNSAWFLVWNVILPIPQVLILDTCWSGGMLRFLGRATLPQEDVAQ